MASGQPASKGVLLTSIFDPYVSGATQARASGIFDNGADLSTLYAALQYGTSAAATGIQSEGVDLNTLYAARGTAQYSLPINGDTFTADPTLAGGISTCLLHFITNNSSWSVTGTASGGGASGSVPNGAVRCEITFTYQSGSTATVTNPLSSMTSLTSANEDCNLHLAAPQASPLSATYGITIQYANSDGSVISTTNCTFFLDTAGS